MEKATKARKLCICESHGTSEYQPFLFHSYFCAQKWTGEKWWHPVPALLWSSVEPPATCLSSRKAPTHTLVSKDQAEHSMKGSCSLCIQSLLLSLLAETRGLCRFLCNSLTQTWGHPPKYDSKGPYLVFSFQELKVVLKGEGAEALSLWSHRVLLILSKRGDIVFDPLISS